MKGEKMDNMLKAYFLKQRDIPERGVNCPTIEILEMYASGNLEPSQLSGVNSHIKGCSLCGELIEGALFHSTYGGHINFEDVPEKVKNRAKCLNPAYKIKRYGIIVCLKKNIWLILSLSSIAASFFIPQHFLQFLILAVIFGLKWVFEKGTTKALIMVYKAWKKHDKDGAEEIERIFKNRL